MASIMAANSKLSVKKLIRKGVLSAGSKMKKISSQIKVHKTFVHLQQTVLATVAVMPIPLLLPQRPSLALLVCMLSMVVKAPVRNTQSTLD